MFDKFGLLEPYRPQSQILWLGDHSLWLGDYKAAMDIVTLKVNKVKTIISVIANMDYKRNDITHLIIPINDNPELNIYRYFDSTFSCIEQGMREGSVLVHCSMGISRSSTIVIAFIMKKFTFSFSKAYNLVKKKRPIICPNSGFIQQLKQYEKTIIKLKLLPEVSFRVINYPNKSSSTDTREQRQDKIDFVPLTDRETHRKAQLKKIYLPSINFVSFNMIKDTDSEYRPQKFASSSIHY